MSPSSLSLAQSFLLIFPSYKYVNYLYSLRMCICFYTVFEPWNARPLRTCLCKHITPDTHSLMHTQAQCVPLCCSYFPYLAPSLSLSHSVLRSLEHSVWYVLCSAYIYRHSEIYEWSNAQSQSYGVSREIVSHKRISVGCVSDHAYMYIYIHMCTAIAHFAFISFLFLLLFFFFRFSYACLCPIHLVTNAPSFSHNWYTYVWM